MSFFKKLFRKEFVTFFILGLVVLGFILIKWIDFDTNEEMENQQYSMINDKETCFNCHQQNSGFSEYHNPLNIGCTSCHLGDPNARDNGSDLFRKTKTDIL